MYHRHALTLGSLRGTFKIRAHKNFENHKYRYFFTILTILKVKIDQKLYLIKNKCISKLSFIENNKKLTKKIIGNDQLFDK